MNTPAPPTYYIGLDPGRETGATFWNGERQMFEREHAGDGPPLLTLDFGQKSLGEAMLSLYAPPENPRAKR